MKVQLDSGEVIDLGTTATAPTIGIIDYSRRVTDDYGVTTVVERGFARRMSVQVAVPFETVDAVQRRLADLRATSALWIADERFASLSVRGFYKEFSIDIASPPLSFCTLSVEGLTGTDDLVDSGNDPAPTDQTSTLQLVQPVTIANAQLVASNVAETDAAEWSASVAYARGVRVIKTATHRIYESVASIAAGDDPEGTSGKWLNVGPTNRWAMFDQALGSVTTANRNVAVTVNAGAIDSVALLDVAGDTVRVQAIGYDRTLPVAEGAITFLDLPANPGQVTVTVIGGGVVSIGTLIVGKRAALGLTEASPTAAITDYSRKVIDEFGEATVVPRAWAKRMTANALIRTKAIDFVMKRISAVRATPCLWIGQDGLDSLTIYGFFKDFSIEVGEGVSKLALTIEGLSTAGKVEPLVASAAWPDITDPTGEKPANNADVTGDNTSKDTKAVAGKPAGEVADAVSASDGSTILTRDVKAALLVATSAIASATAAIAAAQGQIAAAQSVIDSVKAQAATAQGRADDAIVQVGAAAADATAAKNQASAAQSRADQALSGVAAAGGQIDSLRTLTATQGSQIDTNALAISNTKGDLATFSQRVTAGSPNLVQDPTFANGLKSWPYRVGTWDSQSGTGQWGSYAYLYTGAYPGLPGNTFYTIDSAPIVFDANSPITAACDADVHAYDGNISYARIQILCLGANGVEIDGTRISGAAVADPWFGNPVGQNRNALKASGTTPAGTVSVIFRFNVWATNRLQTAALRAVKVERSPVMTAFSAEASFVQTFKALSTLDTQYASLSSIVSTQGASVTQNANALSSLGTTVANLSSTVSSQGASVTTNAKAISAVGSDVATLGSTVNAQGALISQNGTAVSTLGSSLASLTTTVGAQGSQISTNATAISNLAGNLSSLETRVTAGNPNLIRNPTFASGMSDWPYQVGRWASISDTGQWGSYATLDTGAYPGLPGGGAVYYLDAAPIALDAGAPITASCDADAHAYDGNTAYAHIELIFLGSNGVELNGTRLSGAYVANPWFGNPAGQNRAALRVSGTVPAAAVSVLFRFVATATGRLQNANVRQVKVERGAVMTAYSAEATAVQTFKALSTLDTQYASLSSIVSTQGASVTQNANALSSLGTTVSNLSSTVSAQGATVSQNASAISTLSGNVSYLNSVVSTQGSQISENATAISTANSNIATLTSSVVAGNPNLARNPTFANGMVDWASRAGSWFGFSDTGQWGSYAYLDTGAYPGLPGGSSYFLDATPIALDPGAFVTASCDADAHAYDGNTAYAHIELIFLGSNGAEVNGRLFGPSVANPWFGNPAGQNRAALRVSGPVPAGAVSVLFRFVVTATGRLQNASIRQAKVERGSAMTAYSAEATAVQTFKALSTLDTQYASLSTTVSTQGASITQNANALSSLGSTVASLSSTVTAQGASISQNAQAISTTNQQVANLTSTVSAQGVSISQSFTAISQVQGGVNQALGRAALRIDVNGKVVGWEVSNNGQTGDMNVDADHFIVGNRKIFQVDTTTGEVSADDLIVRRVRAKSIETDMLVDHSVTGFSSTSGWGGSVDSGASPSYGDGLSIATKGGVVRIDVSFDAVINSGTGPQFFGQLLRDDGAITRQFRINASAGSATVPIFFTIVDTPPAGTHTYTMMFGRNASGSAVLNYSNGQTYVQEFKK